MFKKILIAAWLAVAAALPAFATSVLPVDLAQIIDQAAVAFQGTVTEVRTGRDPQTGLLVTMTTFRVDDVLKGDVPSSYTVKQIGGEDTASGLKFRAMGVPTYRTGETYVLFMNGVSAHGFTSPVGLSQGRFEVASGEAGLEVGNGRDFRELTQNMPEAQLPAQAKSADKPVRRMGLDDFKAMVRKHAGAKP
jgi:hypothetical protein